MEGILHNTPFALAITDNQGRINIINNVFQSLFGYSKDEIYNQTLEFICPEGSPAEHQSAYSLCKRKRKDGSLVEVEIFTEPNMMGAQQLGYLVFYNDITTRLKAESELQKTCKEYLEVLDHFKTRYEGKDGRTFVGEAAFSPVFKEGQVVGIKGTIRNVTKRIEAEKELAIQKDFLDALLEQTPIAVDKIFKLSKFDRIVKIFPSVDKAVQSFK